MGKRANTGASSAAKKVKAAAEPKVDPAFASVTDAVMEAEQIPQRTRTMLVEMLPFSLKFASDERHELQSMAVDMVEETLTAKKSALDANAAAEVNALDALKASESQLGITVTESEAALASQTEVAKTKASDLEKAEEDEKASEAHLKKLREEDEGAAAKLEDMKKERGDIDAAVAEHFEPMKEGEAKAHFKKLEPFLKKISIESTLLTALPSTCAKKKESRGTFDNIVLEELGKAFNAKIASLTTAIDGEGPAAEHRAAALSSAEQDYNAKKASREQATADRDAANQEKDVREAALAKAKHAVDDFQPQVDEVTSRLSAAQTALADFEAGPFTNFQKIKNRIAAVPEEPAAEATEEAVATEEAAPATEAAAEQA